MTSRGVGVHLPVGHDSVGLPARVFLYTVDQLAVMLHVDEKTIHSQYLYHSGRDIGTVHKFYMLANNIAPPNEKPDWRVTEREFVRWMRHKGFKFYDRGVFQ